MTPATDPDKPDLSVLRAKIAERRAREAAAKAGSELSEYADLVPEVGTGERGISDAAKEVNAACDSMGIFEVYDRLIGGDREEPRGRTEGIMIQCPDPAHPDKHPSAWIRTDEGPGGVYNCERCGVGGNKYTIAAFAWGRDTRSDFWEIKKRLAKEFRGVDYEALIAPMPPMPVSTVIEPPSVSVEDDPFENEVKKATSRELVYREARRRAKQIEGQSLFTPPLVLDLADELEEPDPEIEWTIENLHSVGGNTTITAGFKTGKSTMMRNLLKSLVDHEPFLGSHEVRELSGRVAYFNYEIEQVQMKRDLRDMGIRNPRRVSPVHLRGMHFDLMEDVTFEWAVGELKRNEIEVLILDPFSGAFYGDENSNSEINAFTKRLDELKKQAGVLDLFMPAHTGRYVEEGNERARGGAKLDDWTDNRWVIARHSETGDRYFKAEGRRVEQAERELRFDRTTNTLTYSSFTGSRKEKADASIQADILVYVTANPGCSQNDIVAAAKGNRVKTIAALKRLVNEYEIERRDGPGRSTLHYINGTAPAPM